MASFDDSGQSTNVSKVPIESESKPKIDLPLAFNGRHNEETNRWIPVDHHPLEPLVTIVEAGKLSTSIKPAAKIMDNNTHCAIGKDSQSEGNFDTNPESIKVRPRIRSKPSSPVMDTILPFDAFSNWIHCICVVTFDIELGQAIEKIFPPNAYLSEKERSNICYLSFPDSNSGCMGDTQFHFRTRSCDSWPQNLGSMYQNVSQKYQEQNSEKAHPLKRRKSGFFNSSALQEYNESCIASLEVDSSHYYGYVYFRQTKDPTVKRGYFQKSLVLVSRLPFITLYKTVVSIIANEFFDSASFCVIEHACSEIDTKWPMVPSVGNPGMELSILNKVIHVKIPRKCERNSNSVPYNLISPTLSPKEPIPMLQYKIHPSNSSPSLCKEFSMKDLAAKFEKIVTVDSFPDERSKKMSLQRPLSPPSSIILSSPYEINYFQCFFPLLSDVQSLWELVLTCEPIIVMAPTPDVTCEVVQGLVSMIQPLKYVPDFRPFFTIHDSEFKEYTGTAQAPPPAILGVTNPFFAKTLQHWPNIVRIGEYTSMSPKRISRLPSPKGLVKSSSSTFDSSPGIHSRTKSYLLKDKTIMKRIVERIDDHRPSEVHSAFLKKFFHKLTTSFLEPLERYMISLIPLASVSALKPIPNVSPFNQDEFFQTLSSDPVSKSAPNLVFKVPSSSIGKDSGCHPAVLSGIKGDWIGLYKKFFRSPNFSSYFESKFSELETSLKQFHIKAIFEADLLDWIKGRSEVEIIDLVLILKQKIKSMELETFGGKFRNFTGNNSALSSPEKSTKNDSRESEIRNSESRETEIRTSGIVESRLTESEAVRKSNEEHINKLNKLLHDIIITLPEDLQLLF